MRRPKMLTTAALFLTLGLTTIAHESGDDARHQDFHYYTFDAVPDATATTAWGINSRGDIVGSYTKGGVTHGFLLSEGVLTTIDYEGAASTEARGINARGDIVGVYRIAGEPSVNVHGFLRDKHGQTTPVNVPDHTNTIPQRITNSGVIVGCRHDENMMATMRGIVMDAHDLREDGDVDEYGETDAFASMSNGATPDGQLIVGFFMDMMMANRTRGYLLYGDTVIPFDVPGSASTAAWDVNARGEVVGVYRDTTGTQHGFVWSDLRFRTLDVPGAVSTRAFGVNSHGLVVGSFTDTTNKVYGFVATGVPD
jgi:probable HAF family extracellular repeat protein